MLALVSEVARFSLGAPHREASRRNVAKARRGRARRRRGDADPTPERAVFADAGNAPGAPAPNDSRPAGAGPFGAHDMAGNVREWCAESWGEPPATAGAGTFRVVRGGAWNDPAWKLRAAWRTWSAATERSPTVGFRVAAQRRRS
ncbi:MAG: SUMF1/EgtB/PvdO family nonheme iron enzyme [Thermoanaerobaculia bacterium]